jgi:filamentous hemagglutinin family protein
MKFVWGQVGIYKRLTAILLIVGLGFDSQKTALANPQDGVVVSGQVIITPNDYKLDIIQQTEKAIVDWRKFDIELNEHTEIHQPSQSAIILNRVKSSDPSRIIGRFTANADVLLINPNGIIFGKNSQVDVNSIIASTANISNNDFLNGLFRFAGGENGFIKNFGTIKAKSSVTLLSPIIENYGLIRTKMGKVRLLSGDSATLDFYGDGLFEIAVSNKVKRQLIEQAGKVQANDIMIKAGAGTDVVDSLIRVKGELKSPSVSQKNGKIFIEASGSNKTKKEGNSKVEIHGKIDAASKEQGGFVEIYGDHIALLNGSEINVSGAFGKTGTFLKASQKRSGAAGGEVLIGGDYLGSGSQATAKKIFMAKGANIFADALEYGDGGRVILWADQKNLFAGEISARGGKFGGSGGFIETSAKLVLQAIGSVFAGAPKGDGGLWLLDPNNITIQDFGSNANVNASPSYLTNNDDAILTTSSIQNTLNNGTSVLVQTTSSGNNTELGDILMSNTAITMSGTTAASITFIAVNNITFTNATVTTDTAALNITLQAPTINIANGTLNSAAGNITLATNAFTLAGAPALNTAATFSLLTLTNGTTMGVGTGSTGTLQILDGATGLGAITNATTYVFGNLSGGNATSCTSAESCGNITTGVMTINTTTNFGSADTYFYGTNITLEGTFNKTSGASSNLVVVANQSILIAGPTINSVSNALNVTIWSNYNNNIAPTYGIKFANVNVTTNGGNLVTAGGLDNGGIYGVAGDGVPDGYSFGNNSYAVYNGNFSITTGNGNYICLGSTNNNTYAIKYTGPASITTNAGNIVMYGINNNLGGSAGGSGWGTYLNVTFTTTSGDILVNGTALNSTNTLIGFNAANSNTSLITTTGNIVANGTALIGTGNLTGNGGGNGNTSYQSTSGNITLYGNGTTLAFYYPQGVLINSTMGGTITFNEGLQSINVATTTISSASGTIAIVPLAAGGNITVGVNMTAATLLGVTSAANYIFGAANSGNIIVNTSHNFSTANVSILSGNNITLSANLNKTSGSGTANYTLSAVNEFINSGNTGTNTTSGNINLSISAANITITNGTFNAASGNITLASDLFTLSGTPIFNTLGTFTFKNNSAGTTIGVGNGSSGTIQLTDNATTGLGAITNATAYIYGSATAGNMNISTTKNYAVPVSFFSNNTITLAGTLNTSTGADNVIIQSYNGTLTNANNAGINATSGNINITLQAPTLAITNGTYNAGSGNITLTANSLTLPSSPSFTTTGAFTLLPNSNGTTIGVGGTAGTLSLANISAISAGNMIIGSASAGSINSSINSLTVPISYITGGNFTNSANMTSNKTVFVQAAGNVTLTNFINSTAASNAIILVAGNDFINNFGASALVAENSRWLVYSTNPSNNTINSLSNNFRLFNCSYGGSCPSMPSSANGFLYSYIPNLTATPSAVNITYGDAAPTLTGYAYTLSGYLGSDASVDNITGSINATTNYTQGDSIGTYYIDHSNGALSSAMGYAINYANNASAINVLAKGLTITGSLANDKVYDATNIATFNLTSAELAGVVLSESITLLTSGVNATFSSQNIGNNLTVTFSGFAIAGADSSNYTLTQPTTTANITVRNVTPSLTGSVVKIVDGTTVANLTAQNYILSNKISSDNIYISTTVGNFASANVAANVLVTVNNLTLAGSSEQLVNNYQLTNTSVSGYVGEIFLNQLAMVPQTIIQQIVQTIIAAIVIPQVIPQVITQVMPQVSSLPSISPVGSPSIGTIAPTITTTPISPKILPGVTNTGATSMTVKLPNTSEQYTSELGGLLLVSKEMRRGSENNQQENSLNENSVKITNTTNGINIY